MSEIGSRIKELRKNLNFTQTQLAKKVGLTYIQIGRYENRGALPSSEVLAKLAIALDTTTDYLTNGDQDQRTSSQLKDNKILTLFKKVEQLEEKDKEMIITFLDAFVTKKIIQNIVQ